MVSDRLAIIDKGRLIVQGTVEEIKGLSREKFRVIAEGDPKVLEKLVSSNFSASFGNRRIIYVDDGDEAVELVKKALKSGLKAEASPVTLEDIFVKLIRGEYDDWKND